MENILGQLQFRLEDSRVTYYCGEQYLRNTAAIRSVVDGNQTEFVFVQSEDGELYYVCADMEGLLHRKLKPLNIAGSSFSVVRDDRGFLVVLVVCVCDLYVVRQKVYHSDAFEAPVLLYSGDSKIYNMEAIYWNSQLHLALLLHRDMGHRLVVGIRQEDIAWEELEEVSKDTWLRWGSQGSNLCLEIINENESKRYFPSMNQYNLDFVGLYRNFNTVRLISSCQVSEESFEAFGLVRVSGKSQEAFCGYQNNTWHLISNIHHIVKYCHSYWKGKTHILLLDRVGVVYYVVINPDGTIQQKILMELGLVKDIDLILSNEGLKAYAIDSYSGFAQVMTMLCPNRGWSLKPLIMYYQRQYQVRIMQFPSILDHLRPVSESHILPGLRDSLKLLFHQECSA